MNELRGGVVAILLLVIAPGLIAQPTASSVAARIRAHLDGQQDLPSRTQSFECAEPPAAVGTPFGCHGLLAGGNLIVVQAKLVGDNGDIEIMSSVYYPAAIEHARPFLGPYVVPGIADLRCDPEPLPPQSFHCSGTLVDRSRIVVAAERQDGRLILGPITYYADPPSPVVRAVEAELEEDVTSVRCNILERATSDTCLVTLAKGGEKGVKVLRKANGTFVAGESTLWKVIHGAVLTGLVLGPVLLLASVWRLVSLIQRSVVARVPVTGVQEVSLDKPGDYVLSIEAPRFTNVRGLNYSLHERDTGKEVPLYPNMLRSTTSGWSLVRMSVRRFSVEKPGRYVVQTYVPPGRDASRMSVVLSTAFLLAGFLAAVGLAAGVVLTFAGLVALSMT